MANDFPSFIFSHRRSLPTPKSGLLHCAQATCFQSIPSFWSLFSGPFQYVKQTMNRMRADCLNPDSDTYSKNIGQPFNLSLSVLIAKWK